MNKKRLSKFIHFYKKNNIICAYNSLTMDTIYYENKYENIINDYLNKKIVIKNLSKEEQKIIKEFKSKKYIVNNDFNEENLIEELKPYIFNGVNIKVMVLHLTDFCNLKCKYCFIEGGICSNYKRQNMTKEVISAAIKKYIKILDRGKIKGNPSIVFYGGEPLSNFEVVKYGLECIDEYNNSKNDKYHIDKVIITNGTLITNEIAKVLKEHNVLVSLSMDGIKEVHDYNRIDHDNKGSFDRALRGFKILREEGLEPSISCVMSPFAIKHVDETIEFLLNELKVKGLGFNHVSIIPNLNYYDPEYEEKFADTILHVQEIIQEKYNDVYERRMGHKINCFVDKLLLRADCTGCGEQISISPEGDIGICQGYMGSRKTFNNTVFDEDYYPDQDEVFIEWSNRSPLNIGIIIEIFIYMFSNQISKDIIRNKKSLQSSILSI